MQRITPVVLNLIIINVIVWLCLFLFEEKVSGVSSYFTLYKSDLFLERSIDPELFKPLQIVTYMFNHSRGLFHIFFNMFALANIGPIVEMTLGSKRFLIFYLFAGVFAGIMVAFVDRSDYPVVGASGAISGIITLFAVLYPKTKMSIFPIPIEIEAKNLVIIIASISAFFILFPSFGGNISHFGHLAGMAGALLLYKLEKYIKF